MLNQWLEPVDRASDAFSHFRVVDAGELNEPSEAVKSYLSDLLSKSAVDPDFLDDVIRRLGWTKAQAIVRQRLPAQTKAKRGRFGEVVGVFMLSEFNDYIIPIEKAHFSITGGQSQPSTDAVLIKVDEGLVTEVCFVESKLRTRTDNTAAVEGVQQFRMTTQSKFPICSRSQQRGCSTEKIHCIMPLWITWRLATTRRNVTASACCCSMAKTHGRTMSYKSGG